MRGSSRRRSEPAIFEILSSVHDRKSFSCGVEPLDRYLRELATQDVKRRVSNCFVALAEDGMIAGYYTFAATGIPLTQLPADMAKRLPRYELLPAGLIGRLAVDKRFQGNRLGGALLHGRGRARRAKRSRHLRLADAKDDRSFRCTDARAGSRLPFTPGAN